MGINNEGAYTSKGCFSTVVEVKNCELQNNLHIHIYWLDVALNNQNEWVQPKIKITKKIILCSYSTGV